MRYGVFGLWLSVVLAAGPAAGQAIHLNISQRPGGGEMIGVGRPAPQPAPAPASMQDIVDRAAEKVAGELRATGRLTAATASDILGRLSDSAVRPNRLEQDGQIAYFRTLAWAAATAGDLDRAVAAAARWQGLAPADPATHRCRLFLSFLAADPDAADAACGLFDQPALVAWRPWRAMMSGLTPLIGRRPSIALPLTTGAVLHTNKARGKVVVLYFWTADASARTLDRSNGLKCPEHQANLAETYAAEPVAVVGVNLDSGPAVAEASAQVAAASAAPRQVLGPDGPGRAIAASLGVTTSPVAVALGAGGEVLFAGAPGAWELHTAVAFGLSRAKGAQAAVRPPTPAEEAAAQKLHEQGWDTLRLGLKTHSPTHRRQGAEILRRVIATYPNTRAARQARDDLTALD